MPYRPVQTEPAGLLSFLGIKNMGRNPDALSELLQPVLDLEDWYLRGIREPTAVLSYAAGATGIAVDTYLNTPASEWWYVHDMGVNISSAVIAPLCWVQIGCREISTNNTIARSPMVQAMAGPSATAFAAVNWSNVWIPPLSNIFIAYDATVADTITARGVISRVKV